MNQPPDAGALAGAIWRKASFSHPNNGCVGVARTSTVIGIRDEKNPAGGHLTVSPAAFTALLADVT